MITKKILLGLACATVAPFAFAQTNTTTTQTTATDPSTETITTTTSTEGTVTTFEPGRTVVVRRVGITNPITYALGKTVQYVNRAGRVIEAGTIRPGARVQVYYDGTADTQVVSRVVVDDED